MVDAPICRREPPNLRHLSNGESLGGLSTTVPKAADRCNLGVMSRDIDAELAALRKFYERGLELKQKFQDPRVPYGSLRKIAEAGESTEYANKSRRLAQAFTPTEFERLLSRFKRANHVLGIKSMIGLLRVPAADRDGFVDRAIAERWSSSRMDLEIRKVLGNRRPLAGRKPHVAADADGVIVQLTDLCRQWARIIENIDAKKLPTRLQRAITSTEKAIESLARTLDEIAPAEQPVQTYLAQKRRR